MVNERGRVTMRSVILIVAGVVIGAGMITPAVGHVTNSFRHLWRQHIRPAADERYVNVDENAGGDLSAPFGNLQIEQNAVGSPEIAPDAVTTSEIASETITSEDIDTWAVRESEIMPGSINANHILEGHVLSTHIQDGAVGSFDLSTIIFRAATVTVPGGAAENGLYNVRYVSAACLTRELLVGGGASWDLKSMTADLPIVASGPLLQPGVQGWEAAGANDSGADRTFKVWAMCLTE